MAAYRAAKLRLFSELLPHGAPAVASTALDAESLAGLRAIAARRRLDLRMVGEGAAFIGLLGTTPLADGQRLDIMHAGARRSIELRLPGRFQADNVLVAAALAMATGVPNALRPAAAR